jgi:hypothetical protein
MESGCKDGCKRGAEMWEYSIEVWSKGNTHGYPATAEGYQEFFDTKGGENWELVTVIADSDIWTMFFKRPKTGKRKSAKGKTAGRA